MTGNFNYADNWIIIIYFTFEGQIIITSYWIKTGINNLGVGLAVNLEMIISHTNIINLKVDLSVSVTLRLLNCFADFNEILDSAEGARMESDP